MSILESNTNVGSNPRRAHLILLLIVASYTVFNLVLDPTGATDEQAPEHVALPLMGAIIAQPIMLATWAALAVGPAAMRFPLSLSAATLVFLASAVKQWNLFRNTTSLPMGEGAAAELALFGVTLLLMLIARYVLGWKIRLTDSRRAARTDNQFSLKYLLALTSICAVLLVSGKAVLIGGFISGSSWGQVLSHTLIFAGVFLLALFPLLVIPLTTIAERPSLRTLAAMPFVWAGLTWLAVEIVAAFDRTPRSDIAWSMTLLQGGALATGLLSALALRYGGYRLISQSRRSSE